MGKEISKTVKNHTFDSLSLTLGRPVVIAAASFSDGMAKSRAVYQNGKCYIKDCTSVRDLMVSMFDL